jgi:lauroyl/myristoyl acyltransferase
VYGDGPALFVLIYVAAAPRGSNACHQSNAIHVTRRNIAFQLLVLFCCRCYKYHTLTKQINFIGKCINYTTKQNKRTRIKRNTVLPSLSHNETELATANKQIVRALSINLFPS